MAQKIESDKLLIKDVFQKWYRIPEYQRPYVWGTDQVLELLDDVYQARNSNPDSEYFLGSMVLKKNKKFDGKSDYEEFDLLDGQQRITTLFLITAVVRDLTKDETRKTTCKTTIYQSENSDDKIPERLRIVFDIRDKVRDFVDKYIKTENGTTKENDFKEFIQKKEEDISIKNMSNAILTIRNYFQKGNSIDEFFPYLRSNVLMIYVAAEELEDAFHLFTVMNSRGIKLRNSDILKAENLAKVAKDEKRVDYAKKWESIEEYFAENFDNFLSHLRTILVKQKAGYNLLKEYEDNIYAPKEYDRNTKTYKSKTPLLSKGEETFEFIEKYYNHYLAIFDEYSETTQTNELRNYITLMSLGFEADFWIPVLLRYFDKFKNNKLLEFIKALNNKFSIDWIIGYSPTTRIENMNLLIAEIDKSENPEILLINDYLKFNEREFIRTITGDIYGRRFARYLLLRIDLIYHGHTTKFLPPDTISIEHILPQNPADNSQWKNDFTEFQKDNLIDKIGNLVLISRRKNSAQSNLDYSIKKSKYFKNNVELFSNSVRIYNQYPTWTYNDLIKNHKEVLVKLLQSYSISTNNIDLESIKEINNE